MAGNAALLLENIPLPHPPTPEDADKARRTICANAKDAEEAEMLLRMLDLL